MLYEAEVLSEWENVVRTTEVMVDGKRTNVSRTTLQPLIERKFRADWSDTTGQPIDTLAKGRVIILGCVVEKTELDKIKSDPQHHCLWCRPVAGVDPAAELPEAAISKTEEDALHTFLVGRGATLSARTLAVGPRTPGRTRRDVARRLKAWLRTLKKTA